MAGAGSTMDFFEHQEAARRKTALLIVYFALAVVFIISGVYLAVLVAWTVYQSASLTSFWHPTIFFASVAGVITVVLTGSIYKAAALSRGGVSLVVTLGGSLVDSIASDPNEQRLLNVVEEMAIASGIPVPEVFVLKLEESINAFAIGLTPGDAIIAVTEGCLTELTRDELQGVIAHEFSHILHGDMRLNIRLMGIIYGILVIGLTGRVLVEGLGRGRSRSRDSKGGGVIAAIMVMGLILLVVGYVGVFFGKLIKSAVCRQREFLADASAVQFTRNPSGIAGALGKIATLGAGSRIRNARAEEMSHFFFGNGLGKPFMRLFATHPPIEERIRRIDPQFKGFSFKESRKPAGMGDEAVAPEIPFLSAQRDQFPGWPPRIHLPPDRLASAVGAPQSEHLVHAAKLVSSLPSPVVEAAHEPFGARALVYCLLLNQDGEVRKKQLSLLEQYADKEVVRHTRVLMPTTDTLGQGYRLPLVDMTLPALRKLSASQYRVFRKNVSCLAEADKKITLFEYALHRMMLRHLDPLFNKKKPPAVKYHLFDQVQVECSELLSILAWQGTKDLASAENSFARGMQELHPAKIPSILPREKCSMRVLDQALDRLVEASPGIKKGIIRGCAVCVSADGWITVGEAELLRAVGDSLDCPIPPLFPGAMEG